MYIALITFFARFSLLEELPFFDHMPELRRLYACEEYDKASRLGRDILAAGNCSNREEVEKLIEESEKHSNSVVGNSARFLRGFVAGSSSSVSDAAGAIVSDLFIFGDVRDVLIQSALWAAGKENDPFLLAISGAGLLFEVLPLADWFPAMLKYFHRAGAFTKEFTSHLIDAVKKTKLHGKAERKLLIELSQFMRKAGVVRSTQVMKFVKNPQELSTALRLAKESPEKVHLAVLATDGKVLRQSAKVSSVRLLNAALRGRAGLLTLKRGKLLAVVKIVSSGRFGAFIRHGSLSSKLFRDCSYMVSAFLFICGSAMLTYGILKIKRKKNLKKIANTD